MKDGFSYGSVCSGIEAATTAWHPLGWNPAFFSEIESFPSAVLSHRHPNIPNLGDMTKFQQWPDYAIDLLVGGTPCQSFSVAGLRKGLADPRGNLMLTYLAIAARYRPQWLVWENVPGVLSSNGGKDFGALLGGLGELGYGFAYRVLDAQYVRVESHARAVPQRRRRVFVVGHLGDWRRAAAVLFERESLCGHPAPRRHAGKGVAPTLASRARGGGGLGTDFDCDGGLITNDVAPTLNAHFGEKQGLENQHIDGGCGMFVAHTLLGKANSSHAADAETYVAHTLRGEGFDASEDGTGRGTPLVAYPLTSGMSASAARMPHEQGALIAFSCKDHGADAGNEVAPTMRSMGHDGSHANGGGQLAVAIGIDGGMNTTTVASRTAVRRLTPLECERLQGFPDGWTDIRPKGKPTADGPRYKALGNSMAVNVMRWLGDRINSVRA